MAEIRGERVNFSRKDIVPLHEMPSAQAEDPIIVHCPPPPARYGRFGKIAMLFVMLVVAAIGSVFVAIETGAVDGTLSTRAQSALNDAIGPRYAATVGSTAIRFDSGLRLALEARDVDIVEKATGEHLSRAGAMRMAVDPFALVAGRISIQYIAAERIRLDTAQLPSGDPLPMSDVRIDAMPALLEQIFQRFDEARGLIERTGTGSVRISGIEILLPAPPGRTPITLAINELQLARGEDGDVQVNGTISLNGRKAMLKAASRAVEGVTTSLSARLAGLEVTPFLLQRSDDGTPREGIEGSLDLDLSAVRARETTKPVITATLRQSPGHFYFDGLEQTFSGAEINVAYDFAKNSIELRKSEARFGPTILPFTGAVVDLNRVDQSDQRLGFGLDLLVSGGTATGATEAEQPAHFDLKGNGRYLTADRELQFDQMAVSSPMGRMAGALRVRFGNNQSPEISFGAQLPHMQVTGVKQLWPFWMARKPREWVMDNMFGGDITNGSIAVFIPAGRMKGPGIPMELNANELQISFDLADARINLPGEIPALRDIDGRFELKGEHLQVDIARAASFFPSGRFVAVENGRFSIPSTYTKPLMGELALKLSGPADAVTELSNFRPINALKGTGFKPDDFTGNAKVDLQARMGLIQAHNPPKPTWNAHVELDDVGLKQQLSGRRIGMLDGTLDVDTQAARLAAKGTIDDVPADIALVEPIDSAGTVKRERVIKATLSNDQREKLAPGLSDLIDGTVTAQLTRIDENRQAVALDLGRATLSVPWLGWTKGGGIPAKAQFELSGSDTERTDIRNFELTGDGFGARGNIALAGNSLTSADFSRMQLSPADNYAVSVKRSKGSFDVSISGSALDIRPVIGKLKGGDKSGKGGSGNDGDNTTVRAKLDRLIGFNDQSLSNVSLLISSRSGTISTADFSGATASGQAVVSEMNAGDTISITSGDAGAVVRFMNLYDNMRGGLMNLRLKSQGKDNWSGSVDLRNFSLINEQKLRSLVSSTDQEGRSLDAATKRNIDVTSAKFQRGFASLLYRNGAIAVDNGVVRGEQIGATFQGLVRDAKGNMDMTGTFMPAYGLNRLFGELPLIGAILGNGRDRGLLGITFKLEGQFDKPKLTVNPLSLIAPGIFRQIFEFQ